MAKFAANLTMLFTEFPFLERFEKAKTAGFQAVEYLFPYDYEPQVLSQKLIDNQLKQALFNMPPGDWASGERGLAALPDRIDEFRDSVDTAILYAKALQCPKVHAMSGIMASNFTPKQHEETFIENIRYTADRFVEHGITLVIEPLNNRDVPNYFISHQRKAVELIKKVNRDNVKLQFDTYHAQIMDGDLTTLIQDLADYIGHVQIASVPNRNEPSEGEINYNFIFNQLDINGYTDWIGAEYNPKDTTLKGLDWFRPYQ